MTDEELIEQLELAKAWIQVDIHHPDASIPVNKAYLVTLFDAMLERLKK